MNRKNYMLFIFSIVLVIFFLLGGYNMVSADNLKPKHVVLIGASVGKAWNVPDLAARTDNSRYILEYTGCYQFDKSQPLDELLNRSENKPDAIILKECAAYFPSDITFEEAKKLMIRWIDQSREAGVILVPATIAPVTIKHDRAFETTNPLKRYVKNLLGIPMKTRMDRISEYNDWLKDYSDREGIVYLDLETPLLISKTDRFLKDSFSTDGLHLNREAYQILDMILIPTLDRAFSRN